MTAQELAARLDGRQYMNEITKAGAAEAKAAGLVVVFGYSDDNVELRGAIDEEVGAYEGTTLRVTVDGLLEDWDSIDRDSEEAVERYFERKRLACQDIEAVFADPDTGSSWVFKTAIPHHTFNVMEGDEVFCRGIVFALADTAGPVNDEDPASLAQRLGALISDGSFDQPSLRSAAADLLPRVHGFLSGLRPAGSPVVEAEHA